MSNVVPFRSKNSPLQRWASTAFYIKKTNGDAAVATWITKNVPEQFRKFIREIVNK